MGKSMSLGGILTGAASMCDGQVPAFSPVSQGPYSQKRYSRTVRSNASSIMSLGRHKSEPPVMILPHYNSPYEAIFSNQPDMVHFVGKDPRIGTVCISARPGQGVTHFLVRTVLKFASIEIQDMYWTSPEFDQCQQLYPKKGELFAMIHVALQHCLESIPESEIKRHQVVQHQSSDHSVFVLDEPGWLQSPGYISSLVKGLEEIRHEDFTYVLRNMEAQMRPAALTVDFVIPDQEVIDVEKERFWDFFNGLGDHIEPGTYLSHAPKASLSMPDVTVGNKANEQRLDALRELIQTESSYNKRMSDLVGEYLNGARELAKGPNPLMGKYEIRLIFSNIEQILVASTEFLKDLRTYEEDSDGTLNLGEICRRNLHRMRCYKQYLMRYRKAQETHTVLTKKSLAFKALQEKCVQTQGIQILSNLLVEPTQRIVKYPLLFKDILSGTAEDSPEVEGIRGAIEAASQIAHMEKARPEQNAEILFNIRNIVENCPDSLLSQSRNAVTYLDGYETNLLTGERGRPITLILFSDKVMIARRPKDMSGEVLFQLKEDKEERKRIEKKEKERKEKEKKAKKQEDSQCSEDAQSANTQVSAHILTSGFSLLRKNWKFLGWMDLLRLQVAVVEQTDPEGLFCITTRNHVETKGDLWETTRGIMPEQLDKRDAFISKLFETLALVKASIASGSVSSNAAEYTSRLYVAELELFCNVFMESQYRDFKYKGDVALFYSHGRQSQPMDVSPFAKLPLFVGAIQSTTTGFRAVLKAKTSLNNAGCTAALSEETNRFLDSDAFQIHITELVANLQWTVYNFDPYQSAHLHFSRVYMHTDYLYKTASALSKANNSLRSKSLKKIRDSSATAATLISLHTNVRNSPIPQQLHKHRYSGSFSLQSSGQASSPNSPGGGLVFGRLNNGQGLPPMSPMSLNRSFTTPTAKSLKRADSICAAYDETEIDSYNRSIQSSQQLRHPRLSRGNLIDHQLLSELSENELGIVKALYGIIHTADFELIKAIEHIRMLEQENEATKDLCNELIEENNVIFEVCSHAQSFNKELENIFVAVAKADHDERSQHVAEDITLESTISQHDGVARRKDLKSHK
ncbi:hypothetical protein BG011_010261 [Mortierella polycephala]|uniref:DH domain-containing protein n=1 Tax=Mortierella polycephala TaxID=41804 RepID=A0A9P6PMV7_9FUNG|nr:hypothetical protein BG011_010261 [Mortierella polycephala]